MAKMSDNCKTIFNFLRDNNGDFTAADVANAIGLPKKTVDSTFTAGIQRKGLGERIPAEKALSDGTHEKVKLLKITDLGMQYEETDEQ